MEKENKIRIVCTNCLYSKVINKHETDPSKTRIITTDSCDSCAVEELDGIQYFDSSMNKITNNGIRIN